MLITSTAEGRKMKNILTIDVDFFDDADTTLFERRLRDYILDNADVRTVYVCGFNEAPQIDVDVYGDNVNMSCEEHALELQAGVWYLDGIDAFAETDIWDIFGMTFNEMKRLAAREISRLVI
jgi:hypothetical protein